MAKNAGFDSSPTFFWEFGTNNVSRHIIVSLYVPRVFCYTYSIEMVAKHMSILGMLLHRVRDLRTLWMWLVALVLIQPPLRLKKHL